MLMAATNREIAAGRMTEDHALRKMAVEGAAAPHPSHSELVAKHAQLAQAEKYRFGYQTGQLEYRLRVWQRCRAKVEGLFSRIDRSTPCS